MNAIRISYKVYFTNDEILVKTSPVHTLSRDFDRKDKKCFIQERFAFEKRVADFIRTLSKLYKLVSVDKIIQYNDLDVNEF